MYYLGIDLGGTTIKGAAVSPEGEILREDSRPTQPELGPDHVADGIAALMAARTDRDGTPPAGVGVGCPGVVDPAAGLVRYSCNLRWGHFDLRSALRQRTRRGCMAS